MNNLILKCFITNIHSGPCLHDKSLAQPVIAADDSTSAVKRFLLSVSQSIMITRLIKR